MELTISDQVYIGKSLKPLIRNFLEGSSDHSILVYEKKLAENRIGCCQKGTLKISTKLNLRSFVFLIVVRYSA